MKTFIKIKIIFILFILSSFTFSQYQNIKINSASSTDPEEVSIAINPTNPQNLAAGANIRYFYYSTNSGLNWTQGTMSSTYGVWGDPSLHFDISGNLYYGHLSNPGSPGYWIDRIVVQKSTNGGSSYSSGVGIGYNPPNRNQDKEWIISDYTNSQYRNNIYMAWTEFDKYGSSSSADSSRILFSRSTNFGDSWSVPVKVSDKSGDCVDEDNTVEGAVPAVGPNGEVYLSWAGPRGLEFDKSTDGGITWGVDKQVTSMPGGWDFMIPGINRCNGLPITLADISNSQHRGNVYILWSDQRNGTTNTDVFIIRSTNGGNTWGNVVKVNDDVTSTNQFFTWGTIDIKTGIIWVCFYDRRNYTSGNATDFYVAKSIDGGLTFTNFKASQSSFTPTASVFFGDYSNIAAFNGKIYPIWMRLDGSTLSVWTALIDDVVPVELNYFNGFVNSKKIDLAWTTGSEKNNKGFEIEKASSLNNSDYNVWQTIVFVNGNGTSSSINDYNFTDLNPAVGINKYRLKQIDFDGKFNYSKNVEVNYSPEIISTLLLEQNYPNPFFINGSNNAGLYPATTIKFSIPTAGVISLKIFDMLGNEIKTLVDEFKHPGEYNVKFYSENLPSGIYYYQLKSGNYLQTRKMILMH